MGSKGRMLLAVLLIVGSALLFYRPLLFPAAGQIYPWASDTWGHLVKAEFLYQQMEAGQLYPNIFPQWYNGVQLMRYHAPLPYYLLSGLYAGLDNIFQAGNWFIFLAALGGGLSFLLFRRWIGLFPAVAGGTLFLILPDNVRVAMAEGNLPRVLATALLPITLYFLLRVLNGGKGWNGLAVALLMALIVLSHAMMAAIFAVTLAAFCAFYWLTGGARGPQARAAVEAVFSGLLLSGWWLLPSLTGGITELNKEAAGEALAYFPLTVSLNPWLREGNKEVFYIGLSLAVGIGLGLLVWRWLSPLARSLFLVAIPGILVTTTTFSVIYQSVPFQQLFWPIRFTSFTGFAALLGMAAVMGWLSRGPRLARYGALALLLVLALDFYPSLSLISTRREPGDLVLLSQKLRELPGWRVAAADLSLLGSGPSYLFSVTGGREQVYGWGYQGTTTAPMVSSINFAMEKGYDAYAVDRLEELGADDIVLLKTTKVSPTLPKALLDKGYKLTTDLRSLQLYHKDGAPRAFRVSYQVLGIGRGAQNFALLFPQVAVGSSPRVDDYDLPFLSRFRTLVLSNFSWNDRGKAEALMREYAGAGGQVLVDLTGAPDDVLANEPRFLGVYGEPVAMWRPPVVANGAQRLSLLPFASDYFPWQTYSPQGLDDAKLTFTYMGEEGVALGYKNIGQGQAWFLGLNLSFHALLTGDRAAVQVLEEALALKAHLPPQRVAIPLEDYRATSGGYSFAYTLPVEDELLVPVAKHDGTLVKIDGRRVAATSLSNMVSFRAPQGRHRVEIVYEETPVYLAGKIASGLALLFLGLSLLRGRTRKAGPEPGPRGERGSRREDEV